MSRRVGGAVPRDLGHLPSTTAGKTGEAPFSLCQRTHKQGPAHPVHSAKQTRQEDLIRQTKTGDERVSCSNTGKLSSETEEARAQGHPQFQLLPRGARRKLGGFAQDAVVMPISLALLLGARPELPPLPRCPHREARTRRRAHERADIKRGMKALSEKTKYSGQCLPGPFLGQIVSSPGNCFRIICVYLFPNICVEQ